MSAAYCCDGCHEYRPGQPQVVLATDAREGFIKIDVGLPDAEFCQKACAILWLERKSNAEGISSIDYLRAIGALPEVRS